MTRGLLRFFPTIFLISFFISTFAWPASDTPVTQTKSVQVACSVLLGDVVSLDRFSWANFLSVTVPGLGAPVSLLTYTLDFVLTNLGIEKADLRDLFAGKKVLLVGEGFGELLPALIEAGALVEAVDPLYAFVDHQDFSTVGVDPSNQTMLRHIRNFFEVYGPWLKPGLADALPVEQEGFDFHITHLVYNNFLTKTGDTDTLAILTAVHESIRVLKKGGKSLSVLHGDLAVLHRVADELETLENQELIEGFSVDNLGRKQTKMRTANGTNVQNMQGHFFNLARLTVTK